MIKIIFFAIAVSMFQYAHAESLCDGLKPSTEYLWIQQSIDKKIETFANGKTIASQADNVLSKLIAAKSPMITAWLNKRDLSKKTETEIVKEWRRYFARNFILIKYPSGDAKIDTEIEKLVDGVLKEHLNSKFIKKVEKLFEQAKKESINTLSALNVTEKTDALSRVKAIKLYWPKSLRTARNNAIPLDLIEWGIAYDPNPNEINVGLRAYEYPNDETYLAVFAHEIGHSFDSCRWGAFLKGPWPFQKVGDCLRSTASIGAKTRDDSSLDKMVKENKISAELADSLKQNPTCNKLIYPPIGTQADQLPESFADWFSAEVMAQMKKIDARKLRVDLCESKELNAGSSYPSNINRLNRIYFSNSKLKSQHLVSEELSGSYCSL